MKELVKLNQLIMKELFIFESIDIKNIQQWLDGV